VQDPFEIAIDKHATVDTFNQLLMRMSSDILSDFAVILSSGNGFNSNALEKLYPQSDPDYELFQTFLENHEIVFSGGKNSKNFVVTAEGSSYILKLENRLNAHSDRLAF
jgi:hypothetical protein